MAALWRSFKCVAYKTAHGFTNKLSKEGEYKGPFTHVDSGKTEMLEVRFAEGSDNCPKRRWRTGPGARQKRGASKIVTATADCTAAPTAPGLDRFAVVEKDEMSADIRADFQCQSKYACAGYAHSRWATQG